MQRATGLMLLLWIAPAVGMAQTQAPPVETYRHLRPLLLQALTACSRAQPEPCADASILVRKLNLIAERPLQREWRPRCLGGLAQLETQLSVFRWGMAPRSTLQHQIIKTLQDCPPP